MIKKISLSIILIIAFTSISYSQWNITGGIYNTYNYTPSSSSGLEHVYILYGSNNLNVSFTSSESTQMKAYSYSLNAIDGDELQTIQEGNTITLINPVINKGFFIEQGDRRLSYIWIIDYLSYSFEIKSMTYDEELSDCNTTKLILDRNVDDMFYYTINGRRETITRNMNLSWTTLIADENSKQFITEDKNEIVVPNKEINAEASFCNTIYTLKGDQFLEYWNIPVIVSSEEVEAMAVEGMAFAEQEVRENGNEQDKNVDDLGGSAPVNIYFSGIANYPVTTYQAWELSYDSEFDIIEATYTDEDLDYSFDHEGNIYVRYIISNANATCEKVVAQFTVNVSQSSLEVPNLFTPDSPSGYNQIFKVVYKSLIKYDCKVFNRWGVQVYHGTNPAEGWDGRYKGKLVPTGAYFYVIDAEGVGGKKYKKKGDINVIRTKE